MIRNFLKMCSAGIRQRASHMKSEHYLGATSPSEKLFNNINLTDQQKKITYYRNT